MWILVILLASWFYWGNLGSIIANRFWKNDAAPWEKVVAIYYPDIGDRSKYQIYDNLSNVSECQKVAYLAASLNNDQNMIRGDYICEIGKEREEGALTVYRTSAK